MLFDPWSQPPRHKTTPRGKQGQSSEWLDDVYCSALFLKGSFAKDEAWRLTGPGRGRWVDSGRRQTSLRHWLTLAGWRRDSKLADKGNHSNRTCSTWWWELQTVQPTDPPERRWPVATTSLCFLCTLVTLCCVMPYFRLPSRPSVRGQGMKTIKNKRLKMTRTLNVQKVSQKWV